MRPLALVLALLVLAAVAGAQDSTRAAITGDATPPVTFAPVVTDLQRFWHWRMDLDGRVLCLYGHVDSIATTRRVLVVDALRAKLRCDPKEHQLVGGLAVLEPAALDPKPVVIARYRDLLQLNPGYQFLGVLVGIDSLKRPVIWGAWNLP